MSCKEKFEEKASNNDLLSASPVGYWHGGIILAAHDASRVPRLIIELADAVETHAKEHSVGKNFAARGFSIKEEPLLIGDVSKICLIVSPTKGAFYENFYSLCDFIVERLAIANNEESKDSGFLFEAIQGWVQFFRAGSQITRAEKLLGLIGELLAIRDWIELSSFDHLVWQGPLGGLHDFVGAHTAIEVKATGTRTGPIVHKVSHITQLMPPAKGELYVLSFRLNLGAKGGESVHELVRTVREIPALKTAEASNFLEAALFAGGYSDALDSSMSTFSIDQADLFAVEPSFPSLKLNEEELDPRIIDVVYSMDFSGLQEFKVDLHGDRFEII